MDKTARIKKLRQYHQEHVLKGYDGMDKDEWQQLMATIDSIDFDLMRDLYQKTKQKEDEDGRPVLIQPMECANPDNMSNEELAHFRKLGEEVVRHGELAVVTMAGGQGTRFGFQGPKGAFVFDVEHNKSIFEALCDTLKEACQKYNVCIPWYIMTSNSNNSDTEEFFSAHKNFGYQGDIKFFIQEELPMMDVDGYFLRDEHLQIKMAANGHGGTLLSMQKSGVLAEMKSKGIKWVSINGVDNVLAKPVDTLYIGYAVANHAEAAIKSIAKAYPEEKVGVICHKNDRVGVVEYTEISNIMANLRDKEGNLVYGDSFALFSLFSMEALEKIADRPLPYHVAFKKANYVDRKGRYIRSRIPNSYKFEQFIFDAFELLDNVCVIRAKREEEFAPIKNVSGVDSPTTALRLYRAYHEKHQK